MLKLMVRFTLFIALTATAVLMTSCNEENIVSDEIVQNFVNESVESLERRGNCGRGGCYEFVFPISIAFPDGATVSVDSYPQLRETIKTWKEDNPEAEERPTLVFPLEVLSEDGEVISVATEEELRELRQECRRNFKKHHGKGDRCFKLVFPITINYPDGTSGTYDDRMALKSAVRTWKADNPDAEERPELNFPVDIELEDGTIVTINSAEELQAQKESCGNN